jgi:hypothetical protein
MIRAPLGLRGGGMLLGLRTAMDCAPELQRAKPWYARVRGARPLCEAGDVGAAHPRRVVPAPGALELVTHVGGGIRLAARDQCGNRLGLIQDPHFDPVAVR